MPWEQGSSKRLKATARATVQANKDPHLRRQACSTLLRRMEFSPRAFALASWDKKDCVSTENLPPTSTPNTTNRARVRLPSNSGNVASFRLLALASLAHLRQRPVWLVVRPS